jgi:hypothetical protein
MRGRTVLYFSTTEGSSSLECGGIVVPDRSSRPGESVRRIILTTTAGSFLLLFVLHGIAEESVMHRYVGTKKCWICHMTKAKGSQYTIWKESGHAMAYETLATERAREVYAEAVPGGTEDPQESARCLKCHTTGFGEGIDAYTITFSISDGVGCESCHGPGSEYADMKVMQDRELAISKGLIIPDENTCLQCHNENNPTHQGFDYEAYFELIAHPIPEPPDGPETEPLPTDSNN